MPINKKMGLDILSYSNSFASVDIGLCVGCGTCEERCPVGAVTVGDGAAEVDRSVCVGCGICTPACDTEAIRLVRREGVKPPPPPRAFLEARLKRNVS